MTSPTIKLRLNVAFAVVLAVAAGVFFFLSHPPKFADGEWLLALGVLFLIAIVSELLAIRLTEGGGRVSMDFVPQLGAILLIGPSGAITISAVSWLWFQFFVVKNDPLKALYNTAQIVVAVATASLIFVLLGGQSGLSQLDISDVSGTVVPMLGAVICYFGVNSGAVAYIISVAKEVKFSRVWGEVYGGFLLFDIVVSPPLAFLVAFLWTNGGGGLVSAASLLLAIVPIIALRYSYGLNLELKLLNRDLLQVLIKTLEAQDPYTSGHSIRVAERAKILGRNLGLSRQDLRHLETAALLHDIGKIGNAYHQILKQEGSLTEAQMDLIRQHPERGVEIIKSIRSLESEILEYVRHHHERYDGDGYPDGLEGEEIPLGARIIQISDTIDAMMSDRPYRDALPLNAIKEELREHAGTQFDPRIVKAVFDSQLLDKSLDMNTELDVAVH